MRCPYLKDARVKYCRVSAFKKMIVQTPGQAEEERCSTPGYLDCSVAKQHGGLLPLQSCCPYLQESPAQYCSAAPLTKFIPYSEAQLSRCSGESYRYCEFYLSGCGERPGVPSPPAVPQAAPEGVQEDSVEGIEVPQRLAYSANHMWLEVTEDGSCHVGVDAFLARVFGCLDKLSFATGKGVDNPSVVLTVRGMDFHVVFPNRMLVTRTNGHLRVKPEKLASAPYTLGWLFEGTDPEPGEASAGLIAGAQIRPWMTREVHRLSEFVQGRLFSLSQRERRKVLKAGLRADLIRHLHREDVICLFNEFFAPQADRRTKG
jgi:glycine cleavage system H lipoate-binding protein